MAWQISRMHDRKLNGCRQRLLFARQLTQWKYSLCSQGMLPCVCSDDSKCGKNNEVAHEPQASVSLMFLPHFDVLCDVLLHRPTATWNLFVLCDDQKRKKTDTHTCLVPLYCSRICASLGIFKSQTLLFVSASFFSLSYLYTVSSKSFSTSFLAQSRIMAKTFCKTANIS